MNVDMPTVHLLGMSPGNCPGTSRSNDTFDKIENHCSRNLSGTVSCKMRTLPLLTFFYLQNFTANCSLLLTRTIAIANLSKKKKFASDKIAYFIASSNFDVK